MEENANILLQKLQEAVDELTIDISALGAYGHYKGRLFAGEAAKPYLQCVADSLHEHVGEIHRLSDQLLHLMEE